MQADFNQWNKDSRRHSAAFGETLDKRARFDVEPGHGPARQTLRRAGPDLRLHHPKTNSKLPSAAMAVKWHQNFTFGPHFNADMVTCLLFRDDVTLEDGRFTAP